MWVLYSSTDFDFKGGHEIPFFSKQNINFEWKYTLIVKSPGKEKVQRKSKLI